MNQLKLTTPALNWAITETFEKMPTTLHYSWNKYWVWQFGSKQWIPRYSFTTDIAAAWKLWELMKADTYRATQCLMHAIGINDADSLKNPVSVTVGVLHHGLTPLAIALAYMEWTGERVEIKESDDN